MKDLTLDMISVGDTASFERTWTEKDLEDFAKLSGNTTSIHLDEAYAGTTKFKHRIMYGMHVAILASTLIGMYLPGKRSVCLAQSFSFKKPVYVGDTTKITGTVTAKSASTAILTIAISVTKGNEEIMNGEMSVQVL